MDDQLGDDAADEAEIARIEAQIWRMITDVATSDMQLDEAVVELNQLVAEMNNGALVLAVLTAHGAQMLGRLAEVLNESIPQASKRYADYYQFIDVIKDLYPDEL